MSDSMGRSALALVLAISGALVVPGPAHAAPTDHTWGGGSYAPASDLDSGNWAWDGSPTYWTGDNVPDNPSSINGENAIINDTSGDRNITTPDPLQVHKVTINQSAGSAGVNKLTLGGDMLINLATSGLTLSNGTGSPANLVIDLNGHTLTTKNAILMNNFTLQTSQVGGELTANTPNFGSGAVIGADVTVHQTVQSTFVPNGTWDATSTLVLTPVAAPTNRASLIFNNALIGNLVVGEDGSSTAYLFDFNAGFAFSTQGDVTIHSPAGSTAQNLVFKSSGTLAAATLAVRGDFVDHGAANAANYGNPGSLTGTLAFFGDPGTPSTVSIARQLENNFRVGDKGTDPGGLPGNAPSNGNVLLDQDLTTTGSFLVRDGSALDLADHVLRSGDLTLESGSSLSYTLGSDLGLIEVGGSVSVGGLLFLDTSGLSMDLNSIVLIDNDGTDAISGTFANAPPGTLFSTPSGTYRLVYDFRGNDLALVPEPAALGLLGLGGLLVLRRRT